MTTQRLKIFYLKISYKSICVYVFYILQARLLLFNHDIYAARYFFIILSNHPGNVEVFISSVF